MKHIKRKEMFLAIGTFLIIYASLNFLFGRFCLMRIIVGIPCPACGITRAFFMLCAGKIQEALMMQPLIILVLAAPIVYVLLKKFSKNYLQNLRRYGIIMLIVFVVFYVWRMVHFFPNREPYIYDENNILRCVLKIFFRK